MPWTTTVFAQRPLCVPVQLLLRCRRPYCSAMVTLLRPHCALIRTPNDGVCFEHAQKKRCCYAFYAIPHHLLAVPLRCCGYACDCTGHTSAFRIFLGRHGIAMTTLLWGDRGLTGHRGMLRKASSIKKGCYADNVDMH